MKHVIVTAPSPSSRPLTLLEACLIRCASKADHVQALQILYALPGRYSPVSLAIESTPLFVALVAMFEFGPMHAQEVARLIGAVALGDVSRSDAARDTFFTSTVATALGLARTGQFKAAEGFFALSTLQRPRTAYYTECLKKATLLLVEEVTRAEVELDLAFPEHGTDMTTAAPTPETVMQILGDDAAAFGMLARLAATFDAAGYDDAGADLFLTTFIRGAWPSWRCFHGYALKRPEVVLAACEQCRLGMIALSEGAAGHIAMLGKVAAAEIFRRQNIAP